MSLITEEGGILLECNILKAHMIVIDQVVTYFWPYSKDSVHPYLLNHTIPFVLWTCFFRSIVSYQENFYEQKETLIISISCLFIVINIKLRAAEPSVMQRWNKLGKAAVRFSRWAQLFHPWHPPIETTQDVNINFKASVKSVSWCLYQ